MSEEPTLRELIVRLDGLEKLSEVRFKAQETAVQSALIAQKELTTAAFASSEKAIVKAEEAQKSYNATHNDLSRKMDDQYKEMMPRPEADSKLSSFDARLVELKESQVALRIELMKEIAGLRESRSEGKGDKVGRMSQQQLVMMIVSLIVSFLVIGGAVVSITAYMIRK